MKKLVLLVMAVASAASAFGQSTPGSSAPAELKKLVKRALKGSEDPEQVRALLMELMRESRAGGR